MAYKVLMATYTMKDITSKLGIKRTALQQWIERGYILPSIQAAGGHGTKNLWSREDLLNMAIFQELIRHRYLREEAAEFLRERKDLGPQPARGNLEFETFTVQVTFADTVFNFLLWIRKSDCIFMKLAEQLRARIHVEGVRIVNVTETVRRVAELE